jgi:predicted RNase H-like HicB family nuclease
MLRVPYTSEIFEEDSQVVAVCPELNVSSFADTAEDALDSLQEAVAAFLEECRRMGTLAVVLEEAGYHRDATQPDRWIYRQLMQVNRLEAAVA